mgnify:CR=1 FL=1
MSSLYSSVCLLSFDQQFPDRIFSLPADMQSPDRIFSLSADMQSPDRIFFLLSGIWSLCLLLSVHSDILQNGWLLLFLFIIHFPQKYSIHRHSFIMSVSAGNRFFCICFDTGNRLSILSLFDHNILFSFYIFIHMSTYRYCLSCHPAKIRRNIPIFLLYSFKKYTSISYFLHFSLLFSILFLKKHVEIK